MRDDDQKVNLLLLNDALETGEAAEVAAALAAMPSRADAKIRSLRGGGAMHLAEVFDILDNAGLRLVAVPARPTRTARYRDGG